jgi:hypothetical protein
MRHGSKLITHQLQTQEGSRSKCGCERRKRKHACQRSTYHHGEPATRIGATRTQNKHGGQQGIHSQAAESGGIQMHVWGFGERKQCRLVRRARASPAGWQHLSEQRGHKTSPTRRAARQALTSCRFSRDPDTCVRLGKKTRRLVRGAHASMCTQQHIAEQGGHKTSTEMAGSKLITHQL